MAERMAGKFLATKLSAALVSDEARKGRYFLLGEVNYLDLSTDNTNITDRITASSEVSLTILETGLFGGYRVCATEAVGVDLFGGVRYWNVEGDVDFRVAGPVGENPSQHFNRTKSWIDPIIGVRVEAPPGEKFYVGMLADVGGFGVGSGLQWEAVGKVGYRFSETWALAGGCRHLEVDFDDDGFLLNTTLSGPFVALDVTF